MPLSKEDAALLEEFGVDNVRLQLASAEPGAGAEVVGLGPGFGMTRRDVRTWLAEKTKAAEALQNRILWWAKAAIILTAIGIAVSAAMTIVK
jgi:hypothetical protein